MIRSRWLLAAAAILGAVLFLRLLGGGESTPPAEPTSAPTPTTAPWLLAATAFVEAWALGDYPAAARSATPDLGTALLLAAPPATPGPGSVDPEPLTEGPTWVEARASAPGARLVVSVSWDGQRWLVADIERAE